jgi:homoserine kinase
MPPMTKTPEPPVLVRVAAPATTANLGPGFDAAGLALDWTDTLELRVGRPPEPTSMSIAGTEAELLPTGPGNLIRQAMRALADAVGAELPPGHLTVVKGFPLGRGFGSSSAAVALGLLAARALLRPDLPDAAVLELANRLEGHPDNVAPCLAGGGVLCWQEGGQVHTARLPVHPDLTAVALIAASPLSTGAARAALPEAVPFELAARTAGRAALLGPALAGDFELLLPATDDQLHQPTRLAMDEVAARTLDGLRASGHAAFLSGAGPSLLVLCPADRREAVLRDAGTVLDGAEGWRAEPVGLARTGAIASVETEPDRAQGDGSAQGDGPA